MIFIEKIKNIANNNLKIKMFIDMDGTIVENIYDIKESYLDEGVYLTKLPITPIIDQINKVHNLFKNIELYILSCSNTEQMIKEKDLWVDKYIPFIEKEKRIYLIKKSGGYNSQNIDFVKGEYIKSILKEDEKAIIIDDNTKILSEVTKLLEDKIIAFHVTSLLI